MKQIILILFLFQVSMFSNVFQLSTIVDNQQLIPVIKINGQIVIKVKDVGTKQVFSSSFERSEKIFQSLKELGNENAGLNRIRIRRNKADYVAYVDNIEVYRVTPSDVIGSELTVYQMASLWRDNIMGALKKNPSVLPMNNAKVELPEIASTPLVPFLSIFSNNSFFVMMVQFTVFILIQVCAIFFTFKYLNRRHKLMFEEFHKRLKKFHNTQIRDKNMISSLEGKVADLTLKVDGSSSDNVSNLNG
jgi:hypothetical protein